MGGIVKADAWCNGEVAYLAWEADAPIAGCLGFVITRVHETGAEAGARRILPTWIAFRGQSNPDWLEQDSSVWPIQQFQWRDLTLRRSRNSTDVRPIDFRVHYEIRPVGLAADGLEPVLASDTALLVDGEGKRRYKGTQHPLAFLADPFPTGPIDVTHGYGDGNVFAATFTNGILSTQNLLQQLEAIQGKPAAKPKPGPMVGITPGLLKTLKANIPKPGNAIREFLTADVLGTLKRFMARADLQGGELYCALYELHDPELITDLTKLVAKGRAKVILSTAGNVDPNVKDAPKPKKPLIWDAENHAARAGLHAAKAGATQDRLFNNDDHIGHNKFLVFAKNGQPKAVLTGSTNWTETGLCTQSNNVIVIEDDTIAGHYLDYWLRLRADAQPDGVPVSAKKGREKIEGFAPNKGVQGETLRLDNATPIPAVSVGNGMSVELLFSPNTKAPTKNTKSPTPVDLARVYSLMERASRAIFFLTFYPGVRGEQNIIGEAARLASRQGLLVQGAISNPAALPPAKPGEPDTYTSPNGKQEKLPQRAIWWPDGDDSKVVMVRAAAVSIQTGDLRPELLSAGHAIIHDKIVVIDPLDPVGCTVITGSHNLGFKASYQNDENMLVIRGNQPLAIAYAVHVLDTYDHYVMRAKLEDQRRKALIETGKAPPASSGGFLRLTDDWQDRWFKPGPRTSRDYFLGH